MVSREQGEGRLLSITFFLSLNLWLALFGIIYHTLTSKVFVVVKLDLCRNVHVQYTALLDIEWMDFT